MEWTVFSRFPSEIRCKIYRLTFDSYLSVEITDSGNLFPPACNALYANHAMRTDILSLCQGPYIRWVFRSPSSLTRHLTNFHNDWITKSRAGCVTLVLLAPLGDGAQLTENELGGSRGPHISALFQAWHKAVRSIPAYTGAAKVVVDFDLVHPWVWQTCHVARLVNVLSFIITSRMKGKARFEIRGCKTRANKRYIENSTVGLAVPGVLPSDISIISREIQEVDEEENDQRD